MESDWPELKVADLQRKGWLLVEDGNHGEYRPRPNEFGTGETAFIRAADMEGGRVLFESAQRINETARERISKGIGAPGDVLLSHKGTVGKVARVPEEAPPFVCSPQTTFWRVLDPRRVDRLYLYCLLRSNGFRRQLDSRKGETDMADYVSLTAQRELKISVPPIEVQRGIGNVLGALDDKIELNRRMNRTLEAMAQAIFKSWFVDFDPVVAKADGRKPYAMDDETAALFPDMFQESEVDPIPTGWDYSTIGDEFHLVMGQSPPGETYNDQGEGLPFFQGRTDFGHRYPTRRIFCIAPKRSADAGDTLVCVRAPVGDINMASERCCIGRGLAAIRHKSGSRSYTYYRMKSLYEDLAVFEGDGTLFGSIGGAEFRGVRVVEPDTRIVLEFENTVFPNDQRIEFNEAEILALASFRDTLLPKLLSGEIRLNDAERVVGEVV